MSFIFIFFLGVFSQASWDLNDVSYLLSLPQPGSSVDLLSIEQRGLKGVLLKEEYIDEAPPLLMDRSEAITKKSMRVVGVRLDPCFPLPVPQGCQRQVRLVWQPLQQIENEIVTADAALHSFYNLSEKEFFSLLRDLQSWKKATGVVTTRLPLQVHPGFKNAQFRKQFQDIVLKYAGEKNISRITMMLLRGNSMMWGFLGFDIVDGKVRVLEIARLNKATAQSFINLAQDQFSRGGMSPLPQGADSISNLVAESRRLPGQEPLVLEESIAAFRLENPRVYNSENIDCVSCHVAQSALSWVQRQMPALDVVTKAGNQVYRNARYDLRNTSPTKNHAQVIRAFGYFGKSMAINQRVINESAEVADFIDSLFEK